MAASPIRDESCSSEGLWLRLRRRSGCRSKAMKTGPEIQTSQLLGRLQITAEGSSRAGDASLAINIFKREGAPFFWRVMNGFLIERGKIIRSRSRWQSAISAAAKGGGVGEGEGLKRPGCQSFHSVTRIQAAAFHGKDSESGKNLTAKPLLGFRRAEQQQPFCGFFSLFPQINHLKPLFGFTHW